MGKTYASITVKTDDIAGIAAVLNKYSEQNPEDIDERMMRSAEKSGMYGMFVGVIDVSEPYRCIVKDNGYVTYCDDLDTEKAAETAQRIGELTGHPLVFEVKAKNDLIVGSYLPGEGVSYAGISSRPDYRRYFDIVGIKDASRYIKELEAADNARKAEEILMNILPFGFAFDADSVPKEKYRKAENTTALRVFEIK